MPTAAVLGLAGITRQRTPRIPESEPFNIGPVSVWTTEPFDISGLAPLIVTSVEPFDIVGPISLASVEPFDMVGATSRGSVEPFSILGPLDILLPALDLGDGQVYEASGAPLLGWWEAGAGPVYPLDDLTCE